MKKLELVLVCFLLAITALMAILGVQESETLLLVLVVFAFFLAT